jgi:hypothetical protein
LKSYKYPGTDLILAESIRTGSETLFWDTQTHLFYME